jgi:hypothetical protein
MLLCSGGEDTIWKDNRPSLQLSGSNFIPIVQSRPQSRRGAKCFLLQYNAPTLEQSSLSYYQGASLHSDLHDAWGHTLTSIDSTSTFM